MSFRNRLLRRLAPLASVLALSTLAAPGCIEERAAINRVQPDYLDKRDLVPNQYAALIADPVQTVTPTLIAKEPVFYNQNTLISKPTTTGFSGLTMYSDVEKIRWEVNENYLMARRAYEFIKNAPGGAGGIGNDPQSGEVVAVFRITSHFDIRRAYNTTTGEELNVVEENTSDRPWYQRRYMRVDWSANLITGYGSPLQYEDWEGKVNSEPVPVFVNSPSDPNAPLFVFEGDGEGRKLQYFDIVNRAVLHPETTMITFSDGSGYPKLPVCYLWFAEGSTDCAPAEVTFRNSFRRADPKRDYEPASLTTPLPGQPKTAYLDMERFGVFDQMRLGYDKTQHATTDNNRIHYASRHNLFLHHHALAFGPDSGKACNGDSDCDSNMLCHIGNSPAGSDHRGMCAPLAIQHTRSDISCASDDDCLQTVQGTGVSKTAVCDSATHTCGENYFRCSSNDDCKSVDPQSTCDLVIAATRVDNRGLCLMPFRQRQVRTIAYHESQNYPDYMQAVTEQVIAEWNDAFSVALQAARRRECEIEKSVDGAGTPLASNPCNDAATLGLEPKLGADAKFPLLGCHSPVWGTADGAGKHDAAAVDAAHAKGWDLAGCGPQGTLARIGDLRFSMVGSITDHDNQGYWGLGDIASDPETGEMVAGRGAVWQTITDTYAAYLVQLVRVLNGEAAPDDIADGAYVVTSEKQLGTGQTPASETLDAPLRAPGSLEQLGTMQTGLDKLVLADRGWFDPGKGDKLFDKKNPEAGAMARAVSRIARGGVLGNGSPVGTQKLLGLAGTSIETRLMNSMQARLAPSALPDDNAVLPATLRDASPVRMQSRAMQRAMENIKKRMSQIQCNYEAAFSDDMLLGLAQRLAKGAPIAKNEPGDPTASFGRDWNFKKADGSVDYPLMQQYAAQFIHHGVLAHELGHSFGQRHNFTASADAFNYFDNYWKVRGKGHPDGLKPRYEYLANPADGKYYSQEEIDGRVDEWSYSSVMDYKGLNEDAHGLGRYDYAYVKGVYVNVVEAFREVKDRPAMMSFAVNVNGTGLSTPLDLRNNQVRGVHYTQIPAIMGTNADGTPKLGEDNRYNVFLRETLSEGISGWGDPSFTNITDDKHVLVPYRFDTDNRAGLIWQVQRYDSGADAFESLHYVSERLLNYYFANSYARLRSGFSIGKYQARMQGRYLEQLLQCTQTLAFDLVNFADFFANNPTYGFWWKLYLSDPKFYGGTVNRAVMTMTGNALVALLTMPEMGGHEVQTQFDGTRLYASTGGGSFTIPINEGRAFESNWRFDTGFWWYEMLNRAGAYYDKVMALQTLTNPDLLLLTRDTPTDIRLFEMSYYTMFPEQMTRLFGALLAEDFPDFAPIALRAGGQSGIQRPDISKQTLAFPANGRDIAPPNVLVDPQDHFTVQLFAAVHTMTQFPATYDQRYMDFSRLWLDGSVEAIQVDNPAKNTVSFTDPWTHQTYRALHVSTKAGELGEKVGASPLKHASLGDQPADEAGVAARMILHANDLEVLRQQAIANNMATRVGDIELAEHKYIDLLNVMRDMTSYMGHGISKLP